VDPLEFKESGFVKIANDFVDDEFSKIFFEKFLLKSIKIKNNKFIGELRSLFRGLNEPVFAKLTVLQNLFETNNLLLQLNYL
jgi:hypothetical protein